MFLICLLRLLLRLFSENMTLEHDTNTIVMFPQGLAYPYLVLNMRMPRVFVRA